MKYPQAICKKCLRCHVGDEVYSKHIIFSRHPTLIEEEAIKEQLNRKIFEDARTKLEDTEIGN